MISHVGALRAWDGRPPVGIKVDHRGPGGGRRRRAAATYPPVTPGGVRLRRDGDRRHGQRAAGRADADGRAARDGDGHDRGHDAAPAPSTAASSAAPRRTRCSSCCARSRRCTTSTATWRSRGCSREEWTGESYSDDEFRELAEVLPGLPLMGTGGLGSRVWSGPAITVTGIDVPSVDGALNAVSPHARAKLNLRVHPAQDAAEAQAALVRHLEAVRPFGIALEVARGGDRQRLRGRGPPARRTTRPAPRCRARGAATRRQLRRAAGRSRSSARSRPRRPDAEVLLVGATDSYSNIHAPDERVLLDELEKATDGRGRVLRRVRRALGLAMATRPSALAAAGHAHAARARRHRARRQQDAGPGDPLPVALPRA